MHMCHLTKGSKLVSTVLDNSDAYVWNEVCCFDKSLKNHDKTNAYAVDCLVTLVIMLSSFIFA